MGSNHMHNMLRTSKQKYEIPEYDPQTGEINPYWNELITKEKVEGITNQPDAINMNEMSLDILVDMLEEKYTLQSIGDGFAIMKLVEFYRKNK